MKMISNFIDGLPLESRSGGTVGATFFPVATAASRIRSRNLLPLREAIPLWFAMSSPLIGLVFGFLGAWFVTWLTS
jgi:hypothetical protein